MTNHTSYSKYRKTMGDLSFKKKQLKEVIQKKKQLHADYRVKYKEHCAGIHKEYLDESDREEKMRKQLMDMIPDDW